MKFCVVIADRGDRPQFTDFCFKQLGRMSVSPDRIYHINEPPIVEGFDLVSRIKRGVRMATNDRMDWVFIIENDDYYPFNYFDRFLPYMEKFDFIGEDKTTYYNLQNSTYKTFDHSFRSSLFTTAFRISALNLFDWPTDQRPFLDIDLWKYARHKRRKFIETGAMGMKHGVGLCGGNGHKMRMKFEDHENQVFLRQHTDEIGFEFYCKMIQKLKVKA